MNKSLLLAALAASVSTASVARAQSTFSDVPDNHWAAPAIKRLAELGIIEGYPAVPKRTAPAKPVASAPRPAAKAAPRIAKAASKAQPKSSALRATVNSARGVVRTSARASVAARTASRLH